MLDIVLVSAIAFLLVATAVIGILLGIRAQPAILLAEGVGIILCSAWHPEGSAPHILRGHASLILYLLLIATTLTAAATLRICSTRIGVWTERMKRDLDASEKDA